MDFTELFKDDVRIGRRTFLRVITAVLAFVSTAKDILFTARADAQSVATGLPLPDELIEATMKRLFGNRTLQPGAGKIKLDLPLIA